MTTYIQLVNKLLRKVNEVEVSEAGFNDAIGVTAAAKDCIIDALDTIYNAKYKWPWMLRNQAYTLATNSSIIPIPSDYASIDWDSFVILPDPSNNFIGQWLKPINQEEYWKYHFIDDQNKINQSGGNPTGDYPRYIVTGLSGNSGTIQQSSVTPPNIIGHNLTIAFRYFRKPTRPVNANDVIDLPDDYQYVLYARALYYMYVFYDNTDRAAAMDADFKNVFNDMVNNLLSRDVQHVYAGQVPQTTPNGFGGGYIR